ncbi:MAG: tRNA lysidine(34) synthetase TilS [Coriobacteriia bacterium]|nr:tRNA lysidine(34) synthetase TilS [Coriobacteriia bacterium]
MTNRMHTQLIDKARSSFDALGLACFDTPLVLMVSGGSDSTALLLLAHELCKESSGNLDKLFVLHINHQLRGMDAQKDERFVVELCMQLKIGCKVVRGDIAALAQERGVGVEQAGRMFRYEQAEQVSIEFLSQHAAPVCTNVPANKAISSPVFIATAHTADDKAETLLQRLIVGGGSSSLASIPRQNGKVVRPLLECTRQELCDWLVLKNLNIEGCLWREDATNTNTDYSRAFVRHELIPLLALRNPRIIEGLNRTANVLASESAWLDEQASILLPLSKDSFGAPLPLLRRAIYLACNEAIEELAPGARITFEHVDLIAQGAAANGFACQIPGGIEVRTVKGQLVFSKAKPPQHDPRAKNKE